MERQANRLWRRVWLSVCRLGTQIFDPSRSVYSSVWQCFRLVEQKLVTELAKNPIWWTQCTAGRRYYHMGQVVGRWLWAYRRRECVLRRKELALHGSERRSWKCQRNRSRCYHEPLRKLQRRGWLVSVCWVGSDISVGTKCIFRLFRAFLRSIVRDGFWKIWRLTKRKHPRNKRECLSSRSGIKNAKNYYFCLQ